MPANDPGKGNISAEPQVNIMRAALAELCGTFILVLAGTAVAVSAALARPIAGGPANSLAIGLTFGLALTALVATLGHVSGAHVNPAVTLALASARKFPWKYTPHYLIAQFLGAIFAALMVWATFGNAARNTAFLGATYPAPTATNWQAFLIEATVGFLLVLTITSAVTDRRVSAAVAAPAIGFALAVAVLIAGPISGGAANPARALGPMIVAGRFDAWWVYLFAPVIGGIIAALLYDRVISRTSAPKMTGEVERLELVNRRKAA